jgi:hypothetical protein
MRTQWSGEREYVEPDLARKMLEEVPFTQIAAVPENTFARIRGKALPYRELGVLIAPVSGRSCVVYLVHVEAVFSGNHQHWGERRAAPFILLEDGHRALIDPSYACLRIRYEPVSRRLGFAGCTPPEQELLHRIGVPPDPFDRRLLPQYIFQEARIEPGHQVTACGSGIREPDPEAAPGTLYRGEPRTRLLLSGTASAPIAVSTDPDLV